MVTKMSTDVGQIVKKGAKTVSNATAAVGSATKKGLQGIGQSVHKGASIAGIEQTAKKGIDTISSSTRKGLSAIKSTTTSGLSAVGHTTKRVLKTATGDVARHEERAAGHWLMGIGVMVIIFAILYIAAMTSSSASFTTKAFGWLALLGGIGMCVVGKHDEKKTK